MARYATAIDKSGFNSIDVSGNMLVRNEIQVIKVTNYYNLVALGSIIIQSILDHGEMKAIGRFQFIGFLARQCFLRGP